MVASSVVPTHVLEDVFLMHFNTETLKKRIRNLQEHKNSSVLTQKWFPGPSGGFPNWLFDRFCPPGWAPEAVQTTLKVRKTSDTETCFGHETLRRAPSQSINWFVYVFDRKCAQNRSRNVLVMISTSFLGTCPSENGSRTDRGFAYDICSKPLWTNSVGTRFVS